jgi:hypothetical protein
MRRVFCTALAGILCPALALSAPKVDTLVEQAIKALKTKSYEARLRFTPHFETNSEQVVRIYHVAPDLYRVEPLASGLPISMYFIENAAELVKVTGSNGYEQVQELPERQYSVTDALTAKFLRDLGTHPGTVVLDGQYQGAAVYILRQDVTKEKPYLVTVGLRKDNSFPVFLDVIDGKGQQRMRNRYEWIRFRASNELKDALFTVPEPGAAKGNRAPRPQKARTFEAPPAPGARSDDRAASGAGGSRSGILSADIPLFPLWLPKGFDLEAISVLEYDKSPAPVYEFEVFGPRLDDMLSIVQMQCSELGNCDLDRMLAPKTGGYVIGKRDGWVVAVFGKLEKSELARVLEGLRQGHEESIVRLLSETHERDRMLQQATEYR